MTREMQAISDLSNSGDSLESQSPDIADPALNLHEYDAAAGAVLPPAPVATQGAPLLGVRGAPDDCLR
jgi:hypothetical protein